MTAHMTKRVGEKFSYFSHCGKLGGKQRFGDTILRSAGAARQPLAVRVAKSRNASDLKPSMDYSEAVNSG